MKFAPLIVAFACLACSIHCHAAAAPQQPDQDVASAEVQRLCGVNCLYLIARHLQVSVKHQDLVHLLSPGPYGVSCLDLKRAAEQIGLEARVIRTDPRLIARFSGPIIVRALNPKGDRSVGHFVVVVPEAGSASCWIFDPPRKPRQFAIQSDTAFEDPRVEVLLLRVKQKPAPADAR